MARAIARWLAHPFTSVGDAAKEVGYHQAVADMMAWALYMNHNAPTQRYPAEQALCAAAVSHVAESLLEGNRAQQRPGYPGPDKES